MDIGALATALTTALVPVLPYLLKAGQTATEEAAKAVGKQSLEWAKSLWSKLSPQVETKPAALEAAQDVVRMPDNTLAHGALELQLFKLLSENESLAQEVSRLLEEGKAAGNIVNVSGDRAVGIGGDVSGSTIITGDRNRVKS